MGKLARYDQCASVALALGASEFRDAYITDWCHTEKKWMEDIIYNLKVQQERYPHKAMEAYTALSRVKDDFLPLKLIGSLYDQMAQLVRTMEMKD